MSKFCSKCGSMCMDDARVCTNCGNVFEAHHHNNIMYNQYRQSDIQPGYTQNIQSEGLSPAPKSNKKGIIISVLAVIIAVIVSVVVTVLVINPDGSSAKKSDEEEGVVDMTISDDEKLAENLIKAFDEEKPEAIVKLLPTFAFEDIDFSGTIDIVSVSAKESDWEDCIEDDINYFNEEMDEGYGFDEYSIKYELIDKDVYGKEYLEKLADELEVFEEFDSKKIKQAVVLEYEVVYKGKDKDVKGYASVTLIEYDSKWCLYNYYFSNSSVDNEELPKDDVSAFESFHYSDIEYYVLESIYYGY